MDNQPRQTTPPPPQQVTNAPRQLAIRPKHNWLDIANAILLPIVVAASIISLGINAHNAQLATHQSQQLAKIIGNHTSTLETIKSNQQNNSTALETFFRNGVVCIVTAPATVQSSGVANIKAYVDNCFESTPPVK